MWENIDDNDAPQQMQQQPQRRAAFEWESGIYPARCSGDSRWGMSQNGNPQLCLVFQITDGPAKGRYASWIGTFSPGKATEIAERALRACGWKGVDLNDLTGIEDNDVELDVETEVSQRTGNLYPKVRFVNRPGSGAMIQFQQPLEGAELHSVLANINADIQAIWFERNQHQQSQSQAQNRQRPPARQPEDKQQRLQPQRQPQPQQQPRPQQQSLPPAQQRQQAPRQQPQQQHPQRRQAPPQQPPEQPQGGYYDQGQDDDFPF